ncbi:MAG: glutathione S-transferase family protein [Holosporaceae bacterium]|jgi:glutathione S-transferase|nr:glutathione S-transferase family protein [Holosporaceae bacterium]
MRILYHYPLCAFCRIIRIYLHEKSLEYEAIQEMPWKRNNKFSEFHMRSDIPALVDDATLLEGWYAIVEHLEQTHRAHSILGSSQKEKAEARRIMAMFNGMFFCEVGKDVVFEKVIKKHTENKSSPDSSKIRNSIAAMKQYMNYITWQMDRRNWLAGNDFSLADIAAAAQISCIDYLGSVKWDEYPQVKCWYVRIKSRPSFRSILGDRIPGIAPVSYYSELDF